MSLSKRIQDTAGVTVPAAEVTGDIMAGVVAASKLLPHFTAKFIPSNGDINKATKFRVLRGTLRAMRGGLAYDEAAQSGKLADLRKKAKQHKSYFSVDQYVVTDVETYSTTELKNIGQSESAYRSVLGTSFGSSLGIHLDEYLELVLLNVAKAGNKITYAQDLSGKTDAEIFDLFTKDLIKLGLEVKFNSGNNGKAEVVALRRGIDMTDVKGELSLPVAIALKKYFISQGIDFAAKEIEGALVQLSFFGAKLDVYTEQCVTFGINWRFNVGSAFGVAARADEEGVDIRKIANGVFDLDAKATYGTYKEETDDYVVASMTIAAAANLPAVPDFPVE